jgi:truncated hemoglobin YjbI
MGLFSRNRVQQELYPSSAGHMTLIGQKMFITAEIKRGTMSENCFTDPTITTLDASPDTKDPLYFWQLFSVLGPDQIEQIMAKFYVRVFDDQEEGFWFRDVFAKSESQEYHVKAQTQMWTDCFGGGKNYLGGQRRLDYHHEQHGKDIMTKEGAERWVMHMVAALDEEADALRKCDPRARSAINTFLVYFMSKYGETFDFDSSVFSFESKTPEMAPKKGLSGWKKLVSRWNRSTQ